MGSLLLLNVEQHNWIEMTLSGNLKFVFKRLIFLCFTVFLSGCNGGDSGDAHSSPQSELSLPQGTDNVPISSDRGFLLGTSILGYMHRYNMSTGAVSGLAGVSQINFDGDLKKTFDVANDSIIAVSDNNALVVLDGNSGEYQWDLPVGNYLDSYIHNQPTPPVCTELLCYVMGANGVVAAIDIDSRQSIWDVDLFPDVVEYLDVFPLLVTKERIFAGGYRFSTVFGNVSPKLFVLSRGTGEVIKELPDGWASMAGDLVLISGDGLHAYDFDSLQPEWHLELPAVSNPVVVDDVVVVHTSDPTVPESEGQRIIGIDRTDGTILWSQMAGTLQSFFGPATDGNLVYSVYARTCINYGCTKGYPMALRPSDGSIVWTNEAVDVLQNRPPIIIGGRILYDQVRHSGSDFATGVGSLDPSGGEIQWISQERESFYSLTAVVDGKVIRSNYEPTFYSDR